MLTYTELLGWVIDLARGESRGFKVTLWVTIAALLLRPETRTPMAPDGAQPRPTETSPLLGDRDAAQLVDPGTGLAAAGVESYETDGEEGGEGDLERQVSNGETFKHQGLPDVRKRMKYIFPAIAIGVSKSCESGG